MKLTQGNINSTVNFTVRYRGDNLGAPVLNYNNQGSHDVVRSMCMFIIVPGIVTYREGDNNASGIHDDGSGSGSGDGVRNDGGGVFIITGTITITDTDHPSYVIVTVWCGV